MTPTGPGAATLSAALEREHRQIDGGIEEFTELAATGDASTEPLTDAMHALRRHIYLEEQFLFPALRAAGMVPPVLVMLAEHGELWRTMDDIAVQLADPRVDAERVLQTCGVLLAQLERHNSKEEPIIYPTADRVLAEDTPRLLDFLDGGEMPDGWQCERAGQPPPPGRQAAKNGTTGTGPMDA